MVRCHVLMPQTKLQESLMFYLLLAWNRKCCLTHGPTWNQRCMSSRKKYLPFFPFHRSNRRTDAGFHWFSNWFDPLNPRTSRGHSHYSCHSPSAYFAHHATRALCSFPTEFGDFHCGPGCTSGGNLLIEMVKRRAVWNQGGSFWCRFLPQQETLFLGISDSKNSNLAIKLAIFGTETCCCIQEARAVSERD